MEKFFVVINNATEESWARYMWKDIENIATINLNSNTINNKLLQKIYKIHFSNKINRKIWIPYKDIWKRYFSIKINDLCEGENYIIFQSNVKISPQYIKLLKNMYNVKIILYLTDTIRELGIAKNKKEFKRYIEYYLIDKCFSFDKVDCINYEIEFFDMYSKININQNKTTNQYNNIEKKKGIFYIGNCRSEERYKLLYNLWKRLNSKIDCNFYLFGVKKYYKDKETDIIYNNYLSYKDVIMNIQKNKCILEILNRNQSGNTLRFKEAIVYNKKLLTNNKNVVNSKYYNSKYIQIFEELDEINEEWLYKDINVDYKYNGEFSPKNFLQIIKNKFTN